MPVLEFTGLELATMDVGEFTRRVGQLMHDTGAIHVASGKVQETHFFHKDGIEVSVYFDSWYWTGRRS